MNAQQKKTWRRAMVGAWPSLLLVLWLVVSALWTLQPTPQVFASEDKAFDRDGLSFNYPTDWLLTDKSDGQQQYLALTRPDATLVIAVIASRSPVASFNQFTITKKKLIEPYLQSLANIFGTPAQPAQSQPRCLDLGSDHKVEGVELKGLYRNEQSTAGVYSFIEGGRFISLVYIKADKAGTLGDVAWEMVRRSLKVRDANTPPATGLAITDLIDSGELKALNFPVPDYPTTAMGTKPSGTVVVRIVIAETGAVTAAEVISGHPILRLAALQAAHAAKFAPPLFCGAPTKVTGDIVYRFVGPKMEN